MGVESQENRPFRHYTAKHRVIAWISQNLFGNITYTSRHGLIKGLKRKGGLRLAPRVYGAPGHAGTYLLAESRSQRFGGV